MKAQKTRILLIKLPYWMGIGVDALWAVALFFPAVYGSLTGNPEFNPEFQMTQIMRVGGILMTGWTALLIWAVLKPFERRFVILLTAFPVVFGLMLVSLTNILAQSPFPVWILVKLIILFMTMHISYFLTGRKGIILG